MLNAQIFYLDSSDRNSGTNSNFVIDLPSYQGTMGANTIVCTAAVIPKSWYLVNANLNTFTLSEGLNDFTVTIPIGNYSFTTLRSALETALNAAGAWTYTVTASQLLGKYVITVTGNGGVQPNLTFPAYPYGTHPLARALGMASTETFSADSLTSTYVANLQLTNAVKIMTSFAVGGVLCDIFSATPDYTILRYEDRIGTIMAKPIARLSNAIDIQVVDYITEQPLDLQGGEVLLTIAIYQRSKAMERIADMTAFMYNDRQIQLLREETEKLKKRNAFIE